MAVFRRPGGHILVGALLGVFILGFGIIALGMGSVAIPVSDVIDVVARRVRLTDGAGVSLTQDQIVWQMRLPRILTCVAVGAILAQCGCVLQTLTRNELADPYLLGISSGAATGAVVGLVFGVSVPWVPQRYTIAFLAFIGAVVALGAVLLLATGGSGSLPPVRTILAGVAVAQIASALTSMIIMVFGERGQARDVMSWTLGSFAGARIEGLMLLCLGAACFLGVLVWFAPTLDAFAFGDTAAASLGVNVTATRWGMLAATSLATALTVAMVGPIGFVGLTVPHVMRLLTGPSHRALLPIAALAGGGLMLVADTIARSIADGREIPVGVVTALIGAPVLIVLLRRQAARS
ncbi:MAG: FecCD family ABC transporter permease [Arachnia sp.]